MIRGAEIRMKRSLVHQRTETNYALTVETVPEPHSHSGQCLTDQSTLCYNSLTGQGQLLWVGVCLHPSLGRRLNLVSMVSI
jgi:hypothetical protein